MRKMMCCLGVSWSNSDHTNDDSQSALTDDYDTTKLLLVSTLETFFRKVKVNFIFLQLIKKN